MSLTILCWCGHHMKYHRTQQPNNCTRCDSCQYFRPRGTSNSYQSNKPIKARFDGTCKICNKMIKSGKDEIIRNSKGIWIHKNVNWNDSTTSSYHWISQRHYVTNITENMNQVLQSGFIILCDFDIILKIRIANEQDIIRVYHSPHEVIVRPNSKKVEIYDTHGTLNETYNLLDRNLSWIVDSDTDCAEIVLDLKISK